MGHPLPDGGLLLLRLCLLACVLVVGTAMVRNGTAVLRGIAHGTPAVLPAQPSR